MEIRDTDYGGMGPGGREPREKPFLQIDRKVPLSAIVGAFTAFAVQAVLMWNGQQMQAQKMDTQAAQLTALSQEVRALNVQLTTKINDDLKQDMRLENIERTLNRLDRLDPLGPPFPANSRSNRQ